MVNSKEDREMRVGRRPSAQEEKKTQRKSAGAVGRTRTFDISPTDNYKEVNIRVSDEFGQSLKMAAMLDNCSQTEYIIKNLAPAIKRTIAENSNKLTSFLEDVEGN